MGQLLVSLKIDALWLAAQLPTIAGPSRTDITEKLDSILQRIDETIKSVHTIARELRPDVLDKLGLVAALEWQAEEGMRRSGIQCRVDRQLDRFNLAPIQEIAVFRFVQEALSNVLQHAHATRVTVRVRQSVESLTVSVADDGRGIAVRNLVQGTSLGLIGMRERAMLLGGHFEVRSRKPGGTTVKLTLPLISTLRLL